MYQNGDKPGVMVLDPNTSALMHKIADEAATKAVARTLLGLGIDTSHPLETQKDLANLRDMLAAYRDTENQRDLQYLRDLRHTAQTLKKHGIKWTAGFAAVGFLAFLGSLAPDALKGMFQ